MLHKNKGGVILKKEYSHSKFHDIELKDCKYLGEGHSGRVYLMPDGKVLKIFKSSTSCKAEFDILKSVEGSPHFPKAYELGDHYMIREYVGGMNVYDYIGKYGLGRSFVLKVVDLVDHMKKLGFKKLEVRFPHLFVQEDGTLMMIDPRKSYEEYIPYPKSFFRKLKKMGLLDKFIQILEEERKGLKWIEYIKDM
jgi:predicted Ser/Thr protein kinase